MEEAVEAPEPYSLQAPSGNSVVFDLETTGIPARNERGFMPDYWRSAAYDGARIVSVAWRVLGPAPQLQVIKDGYHVIRPAGFEIPAEATAVHGITQADAERDGIAAREALAHLIQDIKDAEVLVAHNAQFDMSVLRSELCRLGWRGSVDITFRKRIVCTMREGRRAFNMAKAPRLAELLQAAAGEELQGAHDARNDVAACATCYARLLRA